MSEILAGRIVSFNSGSDSYDPSQIKSKDMFIREWVLTDKRMGERRPFVQDATGLSTEFVLAR
jgi:hypothetical protein